MFTCVYIKRIILSIVDGKWGNWASWGTCGGGSQTRTRLCKNLAPQYNGHHCSADGTTDSEIQSCNTAGCSKF